MSAETPLVAAAAAILIAVIGLIASVHYRLGKLEQGQEDMAANQEKGDAETREMVAREIAHTRELIIQTQEMAARENAHTRELLSQLMMQELAAARERSDAQHAETMAAIQRLTDAFLSHSHDEDGTIRFRVPPPDQPPPPADDGA